MLSSNLLDQLQTKLEQHILNLPYEDAVRIRAAYLQTAVTELAAFTEGKFDFQADLDFAIKP